MLAQKLLEAAGNATQPTYIEDVFSTYLYTGNGSTQTITNGIDLAGKGGLVWIKARGANGQGNNFYDTARGVNNYLISNSTGAQNSFGAVTNALTAFNTNGFSLGDFSQINFNNDPFASWTFRKQPKFFDVVTYTGNDVSGRAIAHGLGSIPGCIIVKRTDSAVSWQVYHRSLPTNGANGVYNLVLNTTGGQLDNGQFTAVADATNFYVGPYSGTNASGGTYVAYLFAHNAGGFGLTGTDNVISCGSFTTDGSGNATVNLGYEVQWVLAKQTNIANDWWLQDTMRGMSETSFAVLQPNNSGAEVASGVNILTPTSTGFKVANFNPSGTFIYIAIRRGPMKVPTSGTSVFSAVSRAGTNATAQVTGVAFPPDLVISKSRTTTFVPAFYDKLRGPLLALRSSGTNAETSNAGSLITFNQNGITVGDDASLAAINYSGTYVNYFFERAPSFFDEVCYTGNSTAYTQITHNLAAVPELMIVKNRTSTSYYWMVYSAALGPTKYLWLNAIDAVQTTSSVWSNTAPTASVFTVGTSGGTNTSPDNYVAHLFASCPGVSKVGSYTGTGATQTISCGFTGGARFVLIKRTDSTGDWYVWDTARGMVSGTDPSLLLNSTAAEVNANSVYTTTGGFQIVSTASGINASGGTYIYLAIA